MKKNFLTILSFALVLAGFANTGYPADRQQAMLRNNTISLFADNDWQVIVNVNKFYILGIVESQMKLESVDELSAENIAFNLNITSEKFKRDMRDVQEAALRLQKKIKAIGVGCESCEADVSKKSATILNVLQKMRKDRQVMKKFFTSLEGINLRDPEVDTECPRAISFLACVGICSAAPPPFNVLCAAACWCEFCRDGAC